MNFTLVAKEMVQDNPKLSRVPVIVYIRDMNDNFPEFSKPLYEVSFLQIHFEKQILKIFSMWVNGYIFVFVNIYVCVDV